MRFFFIYKYRKYNVNLDYKIKYPRMVRHSHPLSKVRGSTPPCVWRTSLGEHFTPLWADPVRAWISLDQSPGHRVVYTKKKIIKLNCKIIINFLTNYILTIPVKKLNYIKI